MHFPGTLFKDYKMSEFIDKFVTPECLHRCQLLRIMQVPNIKFLSKNEYLK